MTNDGQIADHYAGEGLLPAIEAGIAALGKTPSMVTIDDLGPVDEFHIGGREATTELCEQLHVDSDSEVLDVGCGIGGPARFVASTFGCRVTGIDLTPEFVDVARTLSDWTSLSERVRFETGSALEMPFDDNSFDKATLLHVGMNIADKPTLFTEVYRVLRPGGRFGVYDIMRLSDADHAYPVPWATDASMSSVATPSTYRDGLQSAGFVIAAERERRQFAIEFFTALRERTVDTEPPPLGLHVHMGPESPTKIANMIAAVTAGTLAPVEMVCEKP